MKKFFTVLTQKFTSKTLISITLMFCALLCSSHLHALSMQRATITSVSSSPNPSTSGDIYGENADYLKAGNDYISNPTINYKQKTPNYTLYMLSKAGDAVTFTINLNAKFRVTSANLCGVIWISSGPSWRGVKDISMKYKLNSGDAWTTATNIVVTDNGGGNNTAGWRGLVDVNPTDFTAQYIQITVKGAAPCVGLSGIRIIGVPFQTLTIKKNNGEADQTMDHWWTGNTQISDPTRTGYRFGGWLQTKTAYSASWAQVFYHYNENGTILFSASDDLGTISINDVDRFSIFNVLDKLKYDNTNYEFLLEYASRPGQYNRWKQTSNPATTYNAVTGYSPVQISWTANYWRGLAVSHLRGQFTFIDGSQEGTEKWFYALGACEPWSGGVPAVDYAEKVYGRLWVRTTDNLSNIGERLTAPLASDALTSNNRYYFRPGGDATITAIWMPNTYTVTYDGNGATGGSTANSSHIYDKAKTLTLNGFTRAGYMFGGWATSAGSTVVAYTDGQSVTNLTATHNGTVTLYAIWIPLQEYTLTLDPNGGSVTPTTYTGYYTSSTPVIANPTRTGYRFGGWLQTKTAHEATWAEVFYHYNNNGTILFSASDDLGTISINDANRFSLFNVLDKLKYDATKYEFLLEYASFAGYNRWKQTSNPATTTESVTGYEAVNVSWTTYDWGGLAKSNSGSTFIDGSVDHSYWYYALGAYTSWGGGVPAASSTAEKNYGRLWVRTTDNFSNIGERLTSALTSDALTSARKYVFREEDATLKAIWIPNTYTVTYNGNGATGGSTANSSHIYNKPSALTTNGFTFDDHVFVGWSTTADGNVEYTDEQSVTNLTETHGATITLYAKWATAYRLHSGTGTTPECYSNELSYTGHFSLYHKQGNALTMQIKDEHDNWINLPGNIECSITNTVIKVKFTYATQILGTISEYTGDFFVRTAAANGGMDDYLNPYMDNKMSLLTGTAKYYWAKHANPQTAMKTIVGNLYNPQISATVCDGKELNDTSAIRVNYERTTNEVKMYQAKDKIASIGATNATIDSLMKCTFTLPTLTVGTFITTTTNITDMQAIAAELINTSLIGKRTRIVYDFATDSIFYSRLINNEMEEINIANSDLVIVATDEATQTLFNPFYVANGRVIYERTFSNNKIWYWISLPYDVNIADVQGIPHYGTAWIMQKYNTEARANLEGNKSTYWEYLPGTAKLNAHEGYLLGFENNYPMPSLLKFPSAYCSTTTTFNTTTSVALPDYTGTHEDKNFDANWHLVGTPLYTSSKVSGPAYIVTINANNTGYFYDRSSATTDLDPFTSFFVQYTGNENFTKPASTPSPAPLFQTKATNEDEDEYYELVMTSPTYSEKTGIIMASDGSISLYELNKDLLMMGSWGKKYPQLFTFGAKGKRMAFNHIAKATQTVVQVGLYVGETETYTFSLKNKEVPAISVILRDKLLGIDTDLLHNNYTFNANTGYANSRFELIINRKADGTTGVLNTTDNAVQFTQNNGKLIISGVEPGTEIRLFDMAGRCLHQSKAQETTTLQSLPSGIYTAVVGTEAHKIVVK